MKISTTTKRPKHTTACGCPADCSRSAPTVAAAPAPAPAPRPIVDKEPTKLCLYDGPSRYTGGRIRAYLYTSKGNTKTGPVAGLVIVPADEPSFANMVKTQTDRHACGNCSQIETCYTHEGRTPVALSQTMSTGAPLQPVDNVHAAAMRYLGRAGVKALRSAVFGDAAALPIEVWQQIEAAARAARVEILGYTHGHLTLGLRGIDHLRQSHMLSVDHGTTIETLALAEHAGWRHFRIGAAGERPRANEFACPASIERNHKLTCNECMACGTDGYARGARSVLIWDHSRAGTSATKRHLQQLSIASTARAMEIAAHRHALSLAEYHGCDVDTALQIERAEHAQA